MKDKKHVLRQLTNNTFMYFLVLHYLSYLEFFHLASSCRNVLQRNKACVNKAYIKILKSCSHFRFTQAFSTMHYIFKVLMLVRVSIILQSCINLWNFLLHQWKVATQFLNSHIRSLFVNRRIRKFYSVSFTRHNCLYLCIRNWQIEEESTKS